MNFIERTRWFSLFILRLFKPSKSWRSDFDISALHSQLNCLTWHITHGKLLITCTTGLLSPYYCSETGSISKPPLRFYLAEEPKYLWTKFLCPAPAATRHKCWSNEYWNVTWSRAVWSNCKPSMTSCLCRFFIVMLILANRAFSLLSSLQ